MRTLTQILIVALGIAVIVGAALGFQGVLPVAGRALRLLANPVVLAGLLAIAVLVRMGRPRRSG